MPFNAIHINIGSVKASYAPTVTNLIVALKANHIAPFFYSTTPSSPTICNGQKIPRPLVSAISSPVRIH